MKSFEIRKEDEGQTLLKYIKRILLSANDSFIFKMLRKKNFVLNDKKATGNEKLIEGDVVKLYLSDDTFNNFAKRDKKIKTDEYMESYARFGNPDIVYEDKHIIILNKPVDMLSQKAQKDDLSANEWLIGYLLYKKELTAEDLSNFMPSVCNRLDRNTGGMLLFGRSAFGSNVLNEMLRERTLDKYYLTAVKGEVKEKANVKAYLSKDESNNTVTVLQEKKDESFDLIKTEYIPVEYIKNLNITFLKVKLITGRSHQIRAHLAHLNHPVIGDFKYGDRAVNERFKKEYKIANQILFCTEMTFPDMENYPEVSGKTFKIKEPPVFNRLRG